jgi:hypothetical protein
MIVLPLIKSFKSNFSKRTAIQIIQKKRNLGTVKITENNVCVNYKRNTIHYDISKIEYLEIHGSLFWEYSASYIYLGELLTKRKFTGKTKLILNFKDKSIAIHFQITTKVEFDQFISIISNWYKIKSFKIREYHLGTERMLLLNPFWAYEKIQELKKELGINSMYD